MTHIEAAGPLPVTGSGPTGGAGDTDEVLQHQLNVPAASLRTRIALTGLDIRFLSLRVSDAVESDPALLSVGPITVGAVVTLGGSLDLLPTGVQSLDVDSHGIDVTLDPARQLPGVDAFLHHFVKCVILPASAKSRSMEAKTSDTTDHRVPSTPMDLAERFQNTLNFVPNTVKLRIYQLQVEACRLQCISIPSETDHDESKEPSHSTGMDAKLGLRRRASSRAFATDSDRVLQQRSLVLLIRNVEGKGWLHTGPTGQSVQITRSDGDRRSPSLRRRRRLKPSLELSAEAHQRHTVGHEAARDASYQWELSAAGPIVSGEEIRASVCGSPHVFSW